MKICKKCKKTYTTEDNYCSKCGKELEKTDDIVKDLKPEDISDGEIEECYDIFEDEKENKKSTRKKILTIIAITTGVIVVAGTITAVLLNERK